MSQNKLVIIGLLVCIFGLGFFLLGKSDNQVEKVQENNSVTKKGETENGASATKVAITNKNIKNTMENEKGIVPETVHGAIISTSMGDIEVEFAGATAPKTVANFVSLVATKFYDGTKFHRVISGFMIQVGDPLSKDDTKQAYWGTGGPGYQFPDELSGKEVYSYGTLAMANSGKNTNGSQFFIVSANPKVDLPPSYTVFGKVVGGMDVVEKIQNTPTDRSNDRPLTAVVIKSVTLK